MAVVDIAFEQWKKDFWAVNPDLASRLHPTVKGALMQACRFAYQAGKEHERKKADSPQEASDA